MAPSSSSLCNYNYLQTCSAESRLCCDLQSPLCSWCVQWSSSVFTQSLLTLKEAQKKGVKLGRSHYILCVSVCVCVNACKSRDFARFCVCVCMGRWVCVVSSNCTQDMYTGFCCGFSALSPWNPAGMSPLITHPTSAVACCVLSLCVRVKCICLKTRVKPAKPPNSTICHRATPFQAPLSSFWLG